MSTTAPVPVGGLFETHLTVSDLGRSVAFYRDVVGLSVALEDTERGAAFLWIGEPGEAMLGLWLLGSAPIGLSLHVAFTASLVDVLGACDRLRSLDVTPLSFFATETTEPSVIGWMPAAAVYFRDPDGHLLEYLTMLDEPPRLDVGILPWSQWTAGDGLARLDPAGVHVERHTGPRGELRTAVRDGGGFHGAARLLSRRGPGARRSGGRSGRRAPAARRRRMTRSTARSRTWPSSRHFAAAESAAP